MKQPAKLLFATNFSPAARVALEALQKLQEHYQLNVNFIYVITSFWKDWLTSGQYETEARQRLETWQRKLEHIKENHKHELFVEKGNSADNILKIANTINPDLIFLGSGKSSKHGRYHTSYTAESVVKNAKQSVWLCKTNKIGRILCAVDGSKNSAKALKEALEIAKVFNAKMCIAHVLHRVDVALGMSDEELRRAEEKYKAEVVDKLQNFYMDFDFESVQPEFMYPWGNPAKIILDLAEDHDKDLIVMGAKGQSGVRNVLMGGTASRILRHAPCSLYVVR